MSQVDNRYLLRVWSEGEGNRDLHATLRDVSNGKVRSFQELSVMVEFLESSLAEPERTGGQESDAPRERNQDA